MPAYNAEAYLKEAIDSILSQTHQNFQFIIINDGSTDNTENIIKQFDDNRILYIRNEKNLGLIYSLNKGLSLCKGLYIARMDADDIALPNRLEEQLIWFNNFNNAIVVGSDYYLLNNNKLSLSVNENDSDYLKTTLLFAPCFCHPTVMIKNIFSEKRVNYDKEYLHAEDFKLWTELSFIGEFRNVNKPLLKYRSHSTQVSALNNSRQIAISETIRREHLIHLGFNYCEDELKIHNLVGSNAFIKSKETLLKVEQWLAKLISQNSEKLIYKKDSFNKAIHKFWLDSCGNTNLGLFAFRTYFASPISEMASITLKQKLKLFIKCFVRQFK